MPEGTGRPFDDDRIEAAVRAVLGSMAGDLTAREAALLAELEMPVLIQVVDRMREARAAPVLAAMRPERARALTTELARHRSRPLE
jgi:flagellar motility protein MotE (MotC chaperone)